VNWCSESGFATVSVDSPPWRTWSHEELERQYSPSTTVPSLSDELARYRDASQSARDQWPPLVKHYGSPDETIDVYRPSGADPVPVVVYLHGGYWQQLSKHDSAFMVPGLIEQHIALGVVDYTLAPHASLFEIVDQCVRATNHVIEHAARLGIDRHRVIVAGSSAGGHLAAMVAHRCAGAGLAGVVCLSGLYDLEPLVGTYINDAVGLSLDDARALSPMYQPLRRGLPPTVIGVGEHESSEFHRQGREYAEALRGAGCEVVTLTQRARHHFDAPFELGIMSSELGRQITRLAAKGIEND
jgi:arylformamidase